MTSRDFCYWLQGFFELSDERVMPSEKVEMIKRHLAMVFVHEIDPSMGNSVHQTDLDTVHAGSIFGKPTIGGEVQTPNGPVRYRC